MGADERLLCNFLNRTTPFPRRGAWRSGSRYRGGSAAAAPAVQAGIDVEEREVRNGGEVPHLDNSLQLSLHEASQATSRLASESNELGDAPRFEAPNVVSVQRDWIMRLEDEYFTDSSDSDFKDEGDAQHQSRSTPVSSIVEAHDVSLHTAYRHDCAICLNTELGAPQMLGCGHVFCVRCIQRHVCAQLRARQWPPCPICKRRIAADELEELRQRREADHAQCDCTHPPCAARPSTANLEYLNSLLERLPRDSDSSGASSLLHAETTSEGSLRSPDRPSGDESALSSTFDAFSLRSALASSRRMHMREPSQMSASTEGYVPYIPFVPYAPYVDDAQGNASHGTGGGMGGGRGGGGGGGSGGGTRNVDDANEHEGRAGVAQPRGMARHLQDLYGRFQGARQHVRQQLRSQPEELVSPGRSRRLTLRLAWRSPRGEL